MNHFVFRLAAVSAITIISQAAVSQKEWNPRIVHLKGNAQVRIYTATKSPRGAIVMRADEVDLNETTGEILPHGDVRLTVEDIK